MISFEKLPFRKIAASTVTLMLLLQSLLSNSAACTNPTGSIQTQAVRPLLETPFKSQALSVPSYHSKNILIMSLVVGLVTQLGMLQGATGPAKKHFSPFHLLQIQQRPKPTETLGPLGVVLRPSIVLMPQPIAETLMRPEIQFINSRTIALTIPSNMPPLTQALYDYFLKQLAIVSPEMHRQLVAMPGRGQAEFSKRYFSPGTIVLLESRVHDPDLAIFLGHELAHKHFDGAPLEIRQLLKTIYSRMDSAPYNPGFRQEMLRGFGFSPVYRQWILEGRFADEFWTWYMVPRFAGGKIANEQFQKDVENLMLLMQKRDPSLEGPVTKLKAYLADARVIIEKDTANTIAIIRQKFVQRRGRIEMIPSLDLRVAFLGRAA